MVKIYQNISNLARLARRRWRLYLLLFVKQRLGQVSVQRCPVGGNGPVLGQISHTVQAAGNTAGCSTPGIWSSLDWDLSQNHAELSKRMFSPCLLVFRNIISHSFPIPPHQLNGTQPWDCFQAMRESINTLWTPIFAGPFQVIFKIERVFTCFHMFSPG